MLISTGICRTSDGSWKDIDQHAVDRRTGRRGPPVASSTSVRKIGGSYNTVAGPPVES